MSPPVKQSTLAGGEIAPALYARSDLSLYEKSARILRNMVCMKQGGATGRPGTQWVGRILNTQGPVRLLPFIFNETGLGQSYVLEFGAGYIAFYQNGENVINAEIEYGIIASISQANPCTITVNFNLAGVLTNGQIILIENILGMVQLNNQYFKVANLVTGATSSFTLTDLFGNPINSTAYGAFITNSSMTLFPIFGIFTITSPYAQADLATLQFAQNADIVTIVHPLYPIQELSRSGPTNWSLTPQNLQDIGIVPNLPTLSGQAAGTFTYIYYLTIVDANGVESQPQQVGASLISQPTPSVPIIVSWPAVAGAVSYNIYVNPSTSSGSATGIGFIGTTTQTLFTDFGITPDTTRQPPVLNSTIGVGVGNYPSTVGFIQQRRFFANTNNNPIGFWGSMTGVYNNFNLQTPQTDASPIFGTLASEEVNAIEHVLEQKFMLMLTSGTEIFVQGNGNGVVTPSAINASVQSYYGSSALRPLKAGDMLIFNQALGSFVRDFAFDFAIDGYRGNDISIFASHLFEGYQIRDWGYQKVPDSIIWAVRSDGQLLSCTYIREQQVLAWTHHDLQNGFVENIVCIPENGEYAVYMSVVRTIESVQGGPSTVRYIERLSSRIWMGPTATVAAGTANAIGDPIDAQYLDANIVYDGRNTTAITMSLTAPPLSFIDTGVNDGIDFIEPLLGNVPLRAAIAPGNYSNPLLLARAVGVAMSAIGKNTYVGSLNVGRVEITATDPSSNPGTFTMNFSPTSTPYSAGSAGVYLGFNETTYNVVGSAIATTQGGGIFDSGPMAYQQICSLQSSAAFFTPTMVGDQIFLQDALFVSSHGNQGSQIKCTIQSYMSPTQVNVTPGGTVVNTDLFDTLVSIWVHAVQNLNGLTYLAGQAVSVWADRYLVASPLNDHVSLKATVSASGTLTLDKPYGVIYVGLPMIQDVETLDLETYFGATLLGRRKKTNGLRGYLYNTRSFYAGSENPDTNNQNAQNDPLFQLFPLKLGVTTHTYDSPPPLVTAQDYVITNARWNKRGAIFLRNVDPVPFTLLAISPISEIPEQTPYYRP